MDKDREPQSHRITIEEIAAIAKENLLREGSHIPTVIAQGTGTTIAFQFTEFGKSAQDRRQQMYQVGILLAQEGDVGILRQAFFVGEGWMSKVEVGKGLAHAPSKNTQRKEILFISHCDVSGSEPKSEMRVWEMVRNTKGKLINLVEFDHHTNVEDSILDNFVAGYAMGLLSGHT